MQHYGVPTRLLDWTTNALVAMYFALQKEPEKTSYVGTYDSAIDEFNNTENSDYGGAIFIINPSLLNKNTINYERPIDVNARHDEIDFYVRPGEDEKGRALLPISILAPHIDVRIRSQSGVFTLHGWNVWALDYYEALRPHIHKIFIPYENYSTMQKEIRQLGISHSFIFPDLTGISKEVTENERIRFSSMHKKITKGK